jgi:diaminohydroxyphosphoribosylaminopyrimidine deaminase/5-amino-6-(5-phosphoribosylamino)uracil reductase
VVVGAEDPNPDHAGRGLTLLRDAGIEVTSGVLEGACADLNLVFNHWISRDTPLVAMKMAMTLDGKFAAASGHSKWVTGAAAREDVMRWRRYFPAVAVGAGTVLADDPSLTARYDGSVTCPRRLVLDRSLRTLASATLPKLYTDEFANCTNVVCHEGLSKAAYARAEALGLHLWRLPEPDGYFNWAAFRERCVQAQLVGVFVETGPRLATALLEGGVADYAFVYQAPKFMSDASAQGIGSPRETESMESAIQLRQPAMDTFGEDRLIRGFIDL